MENGELIPYDKPRGTDGRTQLVDGSGQSLSFNDAIKAIVAGDPDADSMILSKMKMGSGSSTDDSSTLTPSPKSQPTGVNRIEGALNKSK